MSSEAAPVEFLPGHFIIPPLPCFSNCFVPECLFKYLTLSNRVFSPLPQIQHGQSFLHCQVSYQSLGSGTYFATSWAVFNYKSKNLFPLFFIIMAKSSSADMPFSTSVCYCGYIIIVNASLISSLILECTKIWDAAAFALLVPSSYFGWQLPSTPVQKFWREPG